MSELAIIPNDGYTQPGYVAEVKRLHPAVRFTFRPLTYELRAKIGAAVVGKPPEKTTKTLAGVLANQIVEWDVLKADGESLPHDNPASMLLLRPALFDKLYMIVAGNEPSDLDPQATGAEQFEDDANNLDAIYGGRSPANLREETALKN